MTERKNKIIYTIGDKKKILTGEPTLIFMILAY